MNYLLIIIIGLAWIFCEPLINPENSTEQGRHRVMMRLLYLGWITLACFIIAAIFITVDRIAGTNKVSVQSAHGESSFSVDHRTNTTSNPHYQGTA